MTSQTKQKGLESNPSQPIFPLLNNSTPNDAKNPSSVIPPTRNENQDPKIQTYGESSSDVDWQLEKKIVVEGINLRNTRIRHETRRSGISQ